MNKVRVVHRDVTTTLVHDIYHFILVFLLFFTYTKIRRIEAILKEERAFSMAKGNKN